MMAQTQQTLLAEVRDDGLLIRERALNITLSEFMGEVLMFTEPPPGEPDMAPEALIQASCPDCFKVFGFDATGHLESCAVHDNGMRLTMSPALAKMKMVDLIQKEDFTVLEYALVKALFYTFMYVIESRVGRSFGDYSVLEAVQGLVLVDWFTGA